MKNKKLMQATTLGLAGVITATTVMNPTMMVAAETTETDGTVKEGEVSPGETGNTEEETKTPTVETPKEEVKEEVTEVKEENSEEKEKGKPVVTAESIPDTDAGDGDIDGGSTVTPPTIDDIGDIASLVNATQVKDGVVYSKDLKVNIGAASLREDTKIVSTEIFTVNQGVTSDKALVAFDGGSAEISLPEFQGSLTLVYTMSTGEKLSKPLVDLIPEMASITSYVRDTTAPVLSGFIFDGSQVAVGGTAYFTSNGTLTISFKDDITGINKDTWKVSGYDFKVADDGNSVSLKTDTIPEGSSKISVSVEDMMGNLVNQEISLVMFRENPTISGKSHSEVYTQGASSYFSKNVVLTLDNVNDARFSKVELLKDGIVERTITTNDVIISESGYYSIKTTDVVGVEKEYAVSTLFTDIADNFVLDADKPIFLSESFDGSTKEVGNTVYYTSNGNILVSFEDTLSKINKDSWKVKGVSGDTSLIATSETSMTIPTSILEEGKNQFTVSVEDMVGNVASHTVSVVMHRTFPEIAGVSHSDVVLLRGVSYVNKNIQVQLGNFDDSKITSIELLKDDKVVGKVNNGDFTISENGKYSVKVTDLVGDEKVYSMEELFSDMSSTVVFDNTSPAFKESTFTGDAVTVNGNTYYVKNGNIVVSAEDLESGIDKSTWSAVESRGINLISEVSADGSYISIATGNLPEGFSEVTVTVADNMGKNNTKTIGVYMHREFPSITGKSHTDVTLINGKSFITSSVSVELEGYDGEKVSKVELVKDGKVVDTIKNGKFTVSDTGVYSVRVTDIINKTVDFDLKDLFSDITSDIVVDTDSPVYKSMTYTGKSEEKDGSIYYTSEGDFVLTVDDSLSGIDRDTWVVSGVKGIQNNISISADGTQVTIPSSILPEHGTELSFSVKDNMGNELSHKVNIFMLRSFPDIKGKSHSDVKVINNVTYIKEDMSVALSGIYNKSIAKVELLEGGKVVREIKDGLFTVSTTGEYTVQVTDLIGNTKEYKLQSLFNDLSSDVVLDIVSPSLKFSNFTGDKVSVDNVIYYTSDGNIELTFEDKQSGIDVSSWKVTGTEGYSISKDGSTLVIPSSILPEGLSEFKATVSDNLGNTKVYDFSAYMHRYAPEIDGKTHNKVVLNEGSVYTNTALTVELSGYDSEKIKSIELLNGESVVEEVSKGKFTISKSGKYSVKVIDLVNNVSIYKLEDLFDDLTSNVIVDTSAPSVETAVDGESIDSKKWVTSEGNVSVKVSDDIALKKTIVTVNGKEFVKTSKNSKSEEIKVNLQKDVERAADGIYHLEVSVQDMAGNKTTLETKTIKADFDVPKFNELSATGYYVVDNETKAIYIKGDLVLSGICTDIGSGVQKVELFRDGKLVNDKGFPFTIKDSGEYTVKVTDNAGFSTITSVKDILSVDTNTIIADNSAPTISRVSGFDEDLSKDGIKWFSKSPELVYNISDTNIKDVSIKVNGKEQVTAPNADSIYKVDTKDIEGDVKVEVYTKDRVGNESTDTFTFKTDFTAPTDIKGLINKESISKSGKVFFKKVPSIHIGSADSGVGIKEYRLSGSKEEVNTTGDFVLGNGDYFIEIVDRLGNSTGKLAVNSILGLSSNTFVVDGEAPVISTTRPSGDYKGWFSKDVIYDVDLSDNVGIDSASVTINGEEVDKYSTTDTDVKGTTLQADTSKVKPTEQGMYEVKVNVVDNAGNASTWSDTIYIDREAPTVNKFTFTGKGYQEGVNIGGTDRYGFFFDGSASCEISVSDGTVSSGMKDLVVTLETVNGSKTTKTVDISSGSAKVDIPSNFKGFISAYAVDNVNNVGKEERPDGLITEDSNTHINSVSLDIKLPDTKYTDISGNPLYPNDVSAIAEIGDNMSGLRGIEWGIDGDTLGNVSIDTNGNATGDVSAIKSTDKNLVLDLSKVLTMQGNANGLKLWVRITDRVGHTSESSKVFSIDKDAPVISVAYDNTEGDNYYNKTRVATITVKERNFDPAQFNADGVIGNMGNWSNSGDVWTNTITFSEDNEYHFTLNCTDRAGNKAEQYSSESFFIDKTAPKMSVSWNTDSPKNNNFYNTTRVATVTVVEKNFDGGLFTLTGNGSLSGWSSNGDTHTATVTFDKDGEYEFSLTGKDRADNASENFESGKFIVDKTVPVLEVSGVENSVSYKQDLGFTVKMSDEYLDSANSSVVLEGRKNGNIRVNSTLNEKTGEFSFSNMPKEETYDDIYTLRANVADKAGNIVEKTVTFSVNRFGSKYTFLDASILGTYLNAPKDVVITEENVDKLDTNKSRVSIIRDGNEVSVDKKYITVEESGGTTGKYNYTYTVNKEAFNKDGKYLVQVYSHAIEGTDYNSVSEEYAFVLDTQKPEIIVSGVEEGKRYHEYSKKVAIDVRDMSGVKDISVELNGKSVALDKKNGVYSFEIKESDDRQSIHVSVTDLAGNKSEKDVKDFLITSNTGVFLINQLWFKLGIGALLAFLAALIALIAKSRRDSKREEESMLRSHEELIKASTTGSSSSSSGGVVSGTAEKDLVEDFEETSEESTTEENK